MELYCRICGSSKFRPSRFRFLRAYVLQLLLLRLPVRCLNCHERFFTFLLKYAKVRNAYKERTSTV
jgi:hypothetical protein